MSRIAVLKRRQDAFVQLCRPHGLLLTAPGSRRTVERRPDLKSEIGSIGDLQVRVLGLRPSTLVLVGTRQESVGLDSDGIPEPEVGALEYADRHRRIPGFEVKPPDENERFARVERCRNEMTQKHTENPQLYPRDGTAAFFMSPSDVLRVEKELRDTAERVSAVYHSHVGAGAYLSEMDLEYAEHAFFPFPYAHQIVIEVYGNEDAVGRIGIFRRDGVGRPFQGCLVRPVDR